MDNVNVIFLIGNVGTDPTDLSEEDNGIKFKVVTSKKYFSKKKKIDISKNEWHNVKAWNQNAEFARNNIKIGDFVFIRGEIHYHKYSMDDGRQGINPEILASMVIKLNRSSSFSKKDVIVMLTKNSSMTEEEATKVVETFQENKE